MGMSPSRVDDLGDDDGDETSPAFTPGSPTFPLPVLSVSSTRVVLDGVVERDDNMEEPFDVWTDGRVTSAVSCCKSGDDGRRSAEPPADGETIGSDKDWWEGCLSKGIE